MRAFAGLSFALCLFGCRDRLLELQPGDMHATASAQLGLTSVTANETIVFGPGGGPNSSGTEFVATVAVTKNPHPGTAVDIAYVTGTARVLAGAQVADVSLVPSDTPLTFRGTVPSLRRCTCDGPFSETFPNVFRVDFTFAADGDESTLVDQGVDLVCSCLEAF